MVFSPIAKLSLEAVTKSKI
jgi:hypothetical protein